MKNFALGAWSFSLLASGLCASPSESRRLTLVVVMKSAQDGA
jgi:hypothetical protein